MPKIAVNPFMMVNCLFTVGADDYEAHVAKVEFVPTSTSATFKGLDPSASFTFSGAPTWAANIDYAQDWSNPKSLSNYLMQHAGEQIEVIFEPVKGGRSITATLSIQPGAIGGAVDAVATASVSLGSTTPVLEPITP
ncbi:MULTISPECIES: hypothetical protein [unclassified Leucobacter]|uniref:hypothetical protein n=1 Tax=unclassified Leucobacter TaxID=2621730 RepID=UPI0006221467|nr:hypothetical protein [Leucobacter sp. Ag1]KKI19666.1 hypothetical protein XM48_09380 [Leucobacter sp. Ag1]